MKIAFLHMTMGLSNRGSEVVVHELATALAKSHEVLVLQAGPVVKSAYLAQRVMQLDNAPPAAPTSTIDKLLFRLHLNESARLVRRFTLACIPPLRDFDPDIIVAVNGADQVRILREFSSKYKIVVFGHAGIGYDDLDNLRAKPDLFIALTQEAESWAAANSFRETKVVYIPNPIDLSVYHSAKPYVHNLPSPVVLVVGALTAYKNIDVAVQAASNVGASLLLVGDGERGNQISDLLSRYPHDFRWRKSVDPVDMPGIYKSADTFCFVPERQEAFGRVYLEAMAASLPIVASDDPLRHDLVGKQGFFAKPHDLSAVTQALSLALSSPRLSYEKELKSYSLPTVISHLENVFHDLTAG